MSSREFTKKWTAYKSSFVKAIKLQVELCETKWSRSLSNTYETKTSPAHCNKIDTSIAEHRDTLEPSWVGETWPGSFSDRDFHPNAY